MVIKILITGASGLLGHALVEQATEKGYDVCSLYYEHKPEADGRFKWTSLMKN